MLDYRLSKNIRIEQAIKRVSQYVKEDSNVLDIGCGIGIIAESIGQTAKKGKVWACDLSGQNIWYAEKTVCLPNVSFKAVDVLHAFNEIQTWINSPLDVVVMIDVIEHLPLEQHQSLLCKIKEIMTNDAYLVLTFPSAMYQMYLQTEKKDELQIVDESVTLSHLCKVAADAGFQIKHFSLQDMWLTNQYVHAVLQPNCDLKPVQQNKVGLSKKVALRTCSFWQSRILLPKRKKKYVDKIFPQDFHSHP
jgi:2-polyprenyl-3-methyl-5-hydroxy-6-metoxy-1,4-benzoquinol methylase